MKRLVVILFSIFLPLSFIACQDKNQKKHIKIAMVSGIGNIDDKSYNQSAWRGIVIYAKEKHLPKKNYAHITSSREEDFTTNLSIFADKKVDLIIASGYYLTNATNKVASRYPKQNFLLLDNLSNQNNVLSVTFASNEGSFLVGICAALKAKEMKIKKVGFLGGIKSKVLKNFEAGFIAGVKAIDPSIKVIIKYANYFTNKSKGQKIASQMYDDGIKIIYNVAGRTGIGLINEAKKRASLGQDAWVIGVDRDQYEDGIYKDGKSVILTSMIKRLGVVTHDTALSIEQNTFKAGHKLYSLKNNGIGLPRKNPNLKEEWLKTVNEYKKKIIDAKIIVPKK